MVVVVVLVLVVLVNSSATASIGSTTTKQGVGLMMGSEKTIQYVCNTWNLFVLCFGASTLQKEAFSNQNRDHLGSRYIYTI